MLVADALALGLHRDIEATGLEAVAGRAADDAVLERIASLICRRGWIVVEFLLAALERRVAALAGFEAIDLARCLTPAIGAIVSFALDGLSKLIAAGSGHATPQPPQHPLPGKADAPHTPCAAGSIALQ